MQILKFIVTKIVAFENYLARKALGQFAPVPIPRALIHKTWNVPHIFCIVEREWYCTCCVQISTCTETLDIRRVTVFNSRSRWLDTICAKYKTFIPLKIKLILSRGEQSMRYSHSSCDINIDLGKVTADSIFTVLTMGFIKPVRAF